MERLQELFGREHEFAHLYRELKFALQRHGAKAVGALHVTCADESEHECSEAFQRRFAGQLLPRLKYGSRVPVRIANPGARYEWGTVHLAEEHFATPETEEGFKVLLVKINAHVSVDHTGRGLCFGTLDRYGVPSRCCGALHALLEGGRLPWLRDLEEAFLSEGKDRLAALRDPDRVDPRVRGLYAAVANARLQARRVTLDIQEHEAKTPTLYLVLHGVTLNKPGLDTELVGGLYTLDRRSDRPTDRYQGLGDDPARYDLAVEHGKLVLRDEERNRARAARDHRELARERVRLYTREPLPRDERLDRVFRDVAAGRHRGRVHAKALLSGLIHVLASLSPISTALLLVAEGVTDIYHAHRLHLATEEERQKEHARDVIASSEEKVERLTPDRAAEIVDVLVEGHAPQSVA
jgi:hypothetical protein